MEGSRHERVAVLIAAYVIGFTTAYIAFGVAQLGSNTAVPVSNSTATVINAPAVHQQPPASITSVTTTAQGLEATIDGQNVPISATMPNPASGILPDGYNVAITDYSVSPDGQYLYYCEQPSTTVDSCRPFVYSVVDKGIHPVTQNGSRVAFALNAPRAFWGAHDTLNADGNPSLGKPWQF